MQRAATLSINPTARKRSLALTHTPDRAVSQTVTRLTPLAAILDNKGIIRAVNAAWTAAALKNGGHHSTCGIGSDYLAVCDRGAKDNAPSAAELGAAIRAALAGDTKPFQISYSCNGDKTTTSYRARVQSFRFGAKTGIFITHTDLSGPMRIQRLIMEASKRERDLIACDLHDGLAQDLTGAALLVSGAMTSGYQYPAIVRQDLEQATTLIRAAIGMCRSMAAHESPASAANGGLVAAIKALADGASQRGFPVVRFCARSVHAQLPDAISDQVFRITQEALTNAGKHSHGRSIDIICRQRHGLFSVTVIDDGIGIPEAPLARGLGLRIMRHRAGLIGASLTISRPKKGGTRVSVAVWTGLTDTLDIN